MNGTKWINLLKITNYVAYIQSQKQSITPGGKLINPFTTNQSITIWQLASSLTKLCVPFTRVSCVTSLIKTLRFKSPLASVVLLFSLAFLLSFLVLLLLLFVMLLSSTSCQWDCSVFKSDWNLIYYLLIFFP